VTWEPLVFTARKLQPSELKFSVTEKDCLAVVYGLRSWRHFVPGEDVEVVTDHHLLV
jgi:RNase H-like domain found in reverse transcriptase